MARKKPEHYVNNKDFTAAVGAWAIEARAARAEGTPPPPMPDYPAECFHKIAKKYSSRPNFSGYTFKDDMIAEAVYLCLRYAHNFNLEKSNNAFSYFTQYAHNAFLQFISKEKKFATFKFDLVKDAAPTLGKNDFRDINLYDEDNTGIEELDKQEADILKTQVVSVEQIIKEESK